MEWFNLFGLIFMAVIMIPNIVFALKCKDGFENIWQNKTVEILEQIGRLGCFGMMVFNIPGTVCGFRSDGAFGLYLIVNSLLILLYCLIWIVCFTKNSMFRAVSLSVLPSTVFLFSGMMMRSVLLFAAAVIFAPCHILISVKNAAGNNE